MQTTLSERIRKILDEQNLKQTEFAEALGVSVNYISLLANGKKTNISLTLAKLIDALYGYPATWVMEGTLSRDKTEYLRKYAVEQIMKMDEYELGKLEKFIDQNK